MLLGNVYKLYLIFANLSLPLLLTFFTLQLECTDFDIIYAQIKTRQLKIRAKCYAFSRTVRNGPDNTAHRPICITNLPYMYTIVCVCMFVYMCVLAHSNDVMLLI